jgi:CBS domain-containing protein
MLHAKDLEIVRIKQLMRSPAVTATSRVPVWQVASIMDEFGCSFLPIVKDGVAIGVVTARDLITRLAQKKRPGLAIPVDQIMTTPVVQVAEDADAEDVLVLMREKRIHRVVVTNPLGQITGVASLADFAGHVPDDCLRLHLQRHAERCMKSASYLDAVPPKPAVHRLD